ncbi:hypothetical protein Fcan01_16902 [Folsomia candida]|uniref:Uncharacterized protein n=1 Tax=Folsomia candida TaxID=158441 RepID=A0A226DTH3_FOLCA|nr:hypothetical protein Fcan01_16902 [Folsomia candida]
MKDTYNYCSSQIGYTYNNKKCVGPCQPYGVYYYCYTEGGSWDYCSQHVKRPRVTHYSKWGFPCLSSCHNFGGTSYNWCSTQQTMEWGECSKYDGNTINDEQCSTACANRRENYFYCYKVTGGWDYCGKVEEQAVSPIVIKIWQRPSGEYAAELPGQTDSSSNPSPDKVSVQFGYNQAYNGCGRTYRRRRVISQECMWRPLDTERTLDGMFEAFRGQAQRGENMRVENYGGQNPVQTVYRRVFNSAQNLTRTEGIDATIQRNHFRPNNRVDFPQSAITYMRRNLNSLRNEEAGHLVMAALGGPPETYNLVPQHPTVNRNVGAGNRPVEFFSNDWRSVENRMLTFFRAGQPGADGGHIRWRVVIFYRDENTGRPHVFQYLAQFYDANGQLLRDGMWAAIAGVMSNSGVP